MFESEIKLMSLFFFFTLLDEEAALLASTKATDLFFRKMKSSPQMKKSVALVFVTKQVWNKINGNGLRGQPHFSESSGWRWPEGLDLSPWKEFQKSASEDELLALVWCHILKISESDIAEALILSEGTLRYRVGRSLRKLGSMTGTAFRKLEPVS